MEHNKNDFYKPYQNEIYTVNRLLPEGCLLASFNYINRCFNYNNFCREKWTFDSDIFEDKDSSEEKGITFFFTSNWQDFEKYIDKYFENDKDIKGLFERLRGREPLNERDEVNIHYNLLKIFNSYPVNPRKYIDGILRIVAEKCAKYQDNMDKVKFEGDGNGLVDVRFKYVELNLLTQFPCKEFPWLELTFYDTNYDINKKKEKKISFRVKIENTEENEWSCEIVVSQDEENPVFYKKYPTCDSSENEIASSTSMLDKFFYNYLWYFWSIKTNKGDRYLEDRERQDSIKQMQRMLAVPVYSASLPGGDFGTIIGHLIWPMEYKEEGANSKDNTERNIVEKLWVTWAPLTAQTLLKSREEALLAQPIKYSDDILKDLLSKVAFVQDWEKAAVFKKNARGGYDLRYCFKRYFGNAENGHQDYEEIWDICKPEEKCEDICYIRSLKAENQNGGKPIDGKCYYWWHIKNIFDPLVLPSVVPEEIARYENHVICFEFPEYTFFPPKDDKEEAITEVGKHYVNKLIPIFDKLLLKKRVLQHSTKTAVSAIFARNHSHHIGSHVTPRTTVAKIRERLRTLRGISDPEAQLKAIDFMRGQLDEYIQWKADFMAEIATDPLTSTSTKTLFGEIFLPLIQNSLLMDNIAANEGIHYHFKNGYEKAENRLKIRLKNDSEEIDSTFRGSGDCQCGKRWGHINLPYGAFCDCGADHPLMINDTLKNDISVALPGQLGEFTIYCFFENLIRNSVKHNHKELEKKELTVWVKIAKFTKGHPYSDDFYSFEVWDDITDPYAEVATGAADKTKLKDYLSSLIKQSIIEDDGRLKSGAWGIAEMKIMATLLAGSSDFLAMDRNLELDVRRESGCDRLIYKLRVMRPKEVAIIGGSKPEPETIKSHNEKGVFWFHSMKEYAEILEKGASPAAFNFLVLPDNLMDEFKKYDHLAPFRVLIAQNAIEGQKTVKGTEPIAGDIVDSWKENEAEEIISFCWKAWVSGIKQDQFNEANINLGIYLMQECNESPTKDLIDLAEKCNKDDAPFGFSLLTNTEDFEVVPRPGKLGKWLIYDRHFGGWGKVCNLSDDFDFNKMVAFHEGFDKTSADFVPIFAGKPSLENVYALAEAAMLRILVLDERIAQVSQSEILSGDDASDYGGNLRILVAKAANIYIATHVRINGKPAVPLHESVKNASPRFCVWFNAANEGISQLNVYWCLSNDCSSCDGREKAYCDALLIHQGVAETQLKPVVSLNRGKDFADSLSQFLMDIRRIIPYVVVHSGRGIPSNLPKLAKFMPFSRIEEYLMKDRMAKFSLSRRIMTLIRREVQ